MAQKEFRRSLAVFPIGTVMKLTGLTARQIRYYEEYDLVTPQRSSTNRRLYSLNDVDQLLDIADLLDDGMTLKGIRRKYESHQPIVKKNKTETNTTPRQLTDQDVRRILRDELDIHSRFQ